MRNPRPVGLAYPKGTCKVVPFYWRGDDPLKENEKIIEEFRAMEKEYINQEEELRKVKTEYDTIQDELDSYDKFALQIASNLGENSKSTTENASLRKNIIELQNQIQEIEKEISMYKYWSSPNQLGKLNLEDSALTPEIETQQRNIELSTDSILGLQENIGKKIISDKYIYSVSTVVETKVALHCRNALHNKLQSLRNSLNQAKSSKNGVRLTAANNLIHNNPEICEIFDNHCAKKLELEEINLRKELANLHRRYKLRITFEMVEQLNNTISLIGGDPVDIDDMKKSCDFSTTEDDDKAASFSIKTSENSTPRIPSSEKQSKKGKPKLTYHTPKPRR